MRPLVYRSKNEERKRKITTTNFVNFFQDGTVAVTLEMVDAPNLVGRILQDASAILHQAGLQLVATEEKTTSQKPGSVIRQDPLPGTQIGEGTPVYLKVATTKSTVQVPDLLGRTLEEASVILRQVGLQPVTTPEGTTEDKPGHVLRQHPGPGKRIRQGAPVYLVVATAMQEIEVPNMVGRTLEEASVMLREVRLQMVAPEQRTSEHEPGIVFNQHPASRTLVPVGTPVYLTVATNMEAVSVPNLVGQTLGNASTIIHEVRLQMVAPQARTTEDTPGTVLEQTPEAGNQVATGTLVYLVVANSEELVKVPNVIGRTVEVAGPFLNKYGLQAVVTREKTSDRKPGIILRQYPVGGTQVQAGTPVRLVVATAPIIAVPNLVGQILEDAKGILSAMRLQLGATTKVKTTEHEPGTVIDQSPVAGTRIQSGTPVRLVVAAPPMVGVPNLVGRTLDEAREILSAAKLQLGLMVKEKTSEYESGTVIGQRPDAGTQVELGTRIQMIVAAGEPLISDLLFLLIIVLIILIVLFATLAFLRAKKIKADKDLVTEIQICSKQDIGTQKITTGLRKNSKLEMRLRGISDSGDQTLEVQSELIIDERRNHE